MLAQLSDLHLRPGDPGPEARLERAVAVVAAMDPLPDALLVSGDLADVPAPEVYARARELLEAAGLPLVVVSGNHDDTGQLGAAFGDDRLEGRAGPLRVVGVDTSRPGQDGGRVEDRDIARLDAVLSADPGTPTVLAMHHPPVPTGVRSLDAIGLPAADRDAVAQLLLRHPQVKTVACGHVHRAMATTLGGAAVVIAPGVSSQLRLDLRPEADHEIEMTTEPAGLMVHLLVGDGIRSHFQVLPDA
ncbi:MAG TPA: metallophosphoesterase [Thermoleophilaceae bacterium]|nr:metallophosphoesterase [Thermoleophilaceae bacterium]